MMEEESWRRNPGGNIRDEQYWKRNWKEVSREEQ